MRAAPDTAFYRVEQIDGQMFLRYAIADRMRPACISCHNTLPASPKKDWRVGDVRGILEVSRPLGQVRAATRAGLRQTFILMGGMILLAAFGLFLVMRRLTEAYEQEKIAADEMRRADKMKSDFLSTVSHELRTPLTVIRGVAEILLKKLQNPDSAAQRTLVEKLEANSVRMTNLVEQLLDISRLDSGKVPLFPRQFFLDEETARCVESLSASFIHHKIDIDVPSRLSLFIDPTAFCHILGNLLTNAAKFSPRGASIRIQASLALDGGDVIVRVSDEGPGIPPEERLHIFERFYQGSEGLARRGSGLGLSIARRYAELLGGQVWLEPETPGRTGVTFAFSIPLASGNVEAP